MLLLFVSALDLIERLEHLVAFSSDNDGSGPRYRQNNAAQARAGRGRARRQKAAQQVQVAEVDVEPTPTFSCVTEPAEEMITADEVDKLVFERRPTLALLAEACETHMRREKLQRVLEASQGIVDPTQVTEEDGTVVDRRSIVWEVGQECVVVLHTQLGVVPPRDERQVGPELQVVRSQAHGLGQRRQRFVHSTQSLQHKTAQVVRWRVGRVKVDRPVELLEGLFGAA